jgi:hypothetical protein
MFTYAIRTILGRARGDTAFAGRQVSWSYARCSNDEPVLTAARTCGKGPVFELSCIEWGLYYFASASLDSTTA